MTARVAFPELDHVLNDVKDAWTSAVRNRKSPLHTPVVCSADEQTPFPRIMVLREVMDGCSGLRFHTDARSAKAHQIGSGAHVAVLGYDPEERVQFTLRGTGRIEPDSDTAEAAWSTSALSSRRCYLAEYAPGTAVEKPTSGLPQTMLARAPTAEESAAGRSNFCILMIDLTEIEWLKLTSCGNQRARFRRHGDQWQGQWITP